MNGYERLVDVLRVGGALLPLAFAACRAIEQPTAAAPATPTVAGVVATQAAHRVPAAPDGAQADLPDLGARPEPFASGCDLEGDTFATARAILIGASCLTDVGGLHDAIDFIEFSSPFSARVRLELRNLNPRKFPGALEWEFVDSDGLRMQRGSVESGSASVVTGIVAGETSYFVKIRVSAVAHARIAYELSISYGFN